MGWEDEDAGDADAVEDVGDAEDEDAGDADAVGDADDAEEDEEVEEG